MRAAFIDRGLQLLSLLLVLAAWTATAVSVGGGIFPGPADVLAPLGRIVPSGEFLGPLWETVSRTVTGFSLAFVSGVTAGIAIAKVRWVAATTPLLLDALLFAPTLIVIFLGVVMLGTHLGAIALIIALVVGPNIAIYVRDVMRDLDTEIVTMADSYHVRTTQRVRDIYLPYLAPPILAASRIGFSMSWKVVLLAEVFGFPGGLGFQIRMNYTTYNLELLLAWLIVFVVTLLLIEQLIVQVEKSVVRWQP